MTFLYIFLFPLSYILLRSPLRVFNLTEFYFYLYLFWTPLKTRNRNNLFASSKNTRFLPQYKSFLEAKFLGFLWIFGEFLGFLKILGRWKVSSTISRQFPWESQILPSLSILLFMVHFVIYNLMNSVIQEQIIHHIEKENFWTLQWEYQYLQNKFV